MDQSVNIPWAVGMNYGMGVNLLTGDIAGKAIKPITEEEVLSPTKAAGQTVSYDLIQINSMEDLYSSLGMSVEASGRYGMFNASAKAKYANESKFNSQSTFLLARCVVMNAFTQIEDAQVKPEAISLFEEDKKAFHDRYGDGYVRGMQTGGEFFVIISITSSSREDQQSIAASLRATYGTKFSKAQVGVDLNAETQSKMSRSELRVSTYQRGGTGEGQSLVESVEAAMERLKAFPAQIEQHPVPYEVQVANYLTLPLPKGPNPIDIEIQKEALEEYARRQLRYTSLRNDVEFMMSHPDFYESPVDIGILNEWVEYFTLEINKLKRQASKCAGNVDACDLIAFKLPENFDLFYEAQKQRAGQDLSRAISYLKQLNRRLYLLPRVDKSQRMRTFGTMAEFILMVENLPLLENPAMPKDQLQDQFQKRAEAAQKEFQAQLALLDEERKSLYGEEEPETQNNEWSESNT